MVAASAIVIARPEDAPALRKRLAVNASIVVFSASDCLQATHTLVSTSPKIVVLDRAFVMTHRGGALIAQIKTQLPSHTNVRVLEQDETHLPCLLADPSLSLEAASRPLDAFGTRRAIRIAIAGRVEVMVSGETGQLINLSATGAQVVTVGRVRPGQRLSLVLPDEIAQARFWGEVAWATAELPDGTIQYRAGMAFVDPDEHLLRTFCDRYGVKILSGVSRHAAVTI